MRRSSAALAAALFWAGLAAARAAEPAPRVRIEGASKDAASFSADDLKKLPRHKVDAVDRDGKKAVFEGWALGDVLGLAGVARGKALHGPELAKFAVASASDGYRVVFALAELDPGFTDKIVLLADVRDGVPLPASEGPFRLVVPDEKRPARWIRQVTDIEIRSALRNP